MTVLSPFLYFYITLWYSVSLIADRINPLSASVALLSKPVNWYWNQLAGFYIRATLALNGLTLFSSCFLQSLINIAEKMALLYFFLEPLVDFLQMLLEISAKLSESILFYSNWKYQKTLHYYGCFQGKGNRINSLSRHSLSKNVSYICFNESRKMHFV